MPQITQTLKFSEDLQHIADFMDKVAPEITYEMLSTIWNTIDMLAEMPEMGFPTSEELDVYENIRKFIIPFGKSAYVLLYNFNKDDDIIVLLHIKHNRELSFYSNKQ